MTLVNRLREKHEADAGSSGKKPTLTVLLNDLNTYVVVRNVLLLMLIGEGGIDAAIQLWYWPRLTEKTYQTLQRLVRKHFTGLMMQMAAHGNTVNAMTVMEEMLILKNSIVFCGLSCSAWSLLLEMTIDAKKWGAGGAKLAAENRRKVVKNPKKRDWNEQGLYFIRPEWRNSHDAYEEDGTVAPFQDQALRDTMLTRPNP